MKSITPTAAQLAKESAMDDAEIAAWNAGSATPEAPEGEDLIEATQSEKAPVAANPSKVNPKFLAYLQELSAVAVDAAQREMDSRQAQGEDMTGATIDPVTYKIIRHPDVVKAETEWMMAQVKSDVLADGTPAISPATRMMEEATKEFGSKLNLAPTKKLS